MISHRKKEVTGNRPVGLPLWHGEDREQLFALTRERRESIFRDTQIEVPSVITRCSRRNNAQGPTVGRVDQ
jgi:hypothetical protein